MVLCFHDLKAFHYRNIGGLIICMLHSPFSKYFIFNTTQDFLVMLLWVCGGGERELIDWVQFFQCKCTKSNSSIMEVRLHS